MERYFYLNVAVFLVFSITVLLERTDVEGALPENIQYTNSHGTREKQLLDALQGVLEKLQNKRIEAWKKKFSQVPKCSFGDICAIRKGARIGKLCDCPQMTICNSFLLKCL
ncbi:cocaine- and amphetamine-regulated transcript protein-like [Protopterus annectens]|uniref:cocaine- and amphetamine-regulated transcript protein-like n=1 Tax=Protopterus annectens TaxID=7888 RepID=UPI001CFA2B05|nr:cocaine- and amphetamine-regulated transcript protein-like [Protopterus annectens]